METALEEGGQRWWWLFKIVRRWTSKPEMSGQWADLEWCMMLMSGGGSWWPGVGKGWPTMMVDLEDCATMVVQRRSVWALQEVQRSWRRKRDSR
ncbi:hypothetical protein Pint_31828 [Pistacia integerrima]|uniref:Uncharacterized protein n=1 Tax=Pistacia integerrima TaxID=434235 RepID=A0ACC0XN02_9ROSI|nr:hypothetical protein Pint_31828 [Pistacia integerrima]